MCTLHTPQQQTDDSDRHPNVNKSTHQMAPAVRHLTSGVGECIYVREKALGGIIMPVAINIIYKLNLLLGRMQDEATYNL